MADPLVTTAEVTAAWPAIANLDAGEQAALIAAAGGVLALAAGFAIGLDAHREVLRPGRRRALRLRHAPVVALERVAADPAPLLWISGPSGSSRASVVTSPTGLVLQATTAGTSSASSPILVASCATLGALAAAIAAVPGWAAQVATGYAAWATADLELADGFQGAGAGQQAEVWGYTADLGGLDLDAEAGEVALAYAQPDGFRYPDRRWAGAARRGTVLVRYTAGYATADVPPELKRAAILAARGLRERIAAATPLRSETIGEYAYTLADLPPATAQLVADLVTPHIRYRIG